MIVCTPVPLHVKQRTKHWHEIRQKGGPGNPFPVAIGCSDIPTIMGESPYAGIKDLWTQKMGLKERPATNKQQRMGKLAEPILLEAASDMMMTRLVPAMYYASEAPWIVASLDGVAAAMASGGNVLSLPASVAEIKLTNEKNMGMLRAGKCPVEWYGQVQGQMMVCNVHEVYVFASTPSGADLLSQGLEGQHVMLVVLRDNVYIEDMFVHVELFCESVMEGIPADVYVPEELLKIGQGVRVWESRYPVEITF